MARFRWTSLTVLVALSVAACGGNGGETGDPEGGGSIVYAEFYAPAAGWDPASDDAPVLSRAGCLEPLLRYQADGTLSENLATSWEQVKPTAWDFKLREGVKFQDGTPMDADAVVGALQHLLDGETAARSFNPDVVSGVKSVDSSTVEITTPAPDALLPLRMTSPNTGILAAKAYDGEQINIEGTCTGPFTVVKEVPGQSLELEGNENYWGGKPGVASAEVRFVGEGATRVTQLQTGEADIASVVPALSLAALKGDDNVALKTVQSPRTTAMILNNTRAPFDDPLVRRALQYAIDTETIAATVYEGGAIPAVGPFSPDDPWAPESAAPVAYDPEEAQRLLKEAGVDPSSVSFELVAYNDRPEFADLAAVIQDQLGELGVKVKIRAGDYASVEPDLLAGDFDATLFSRGYLSDFPDPAGSLLSDYTCKGSFNVARYCEPGTDALINKASKTADSDARHGLEADIAEKLQAGAVNVYLVHESLTTALGSRVKGFVPDPLNFRVLTSELSVD